MYNHNPKEINKNYPQHSYEFIVCMITGNFKKRIDKKYLNTLDITKEEYILKFPNAPTMSQKSRDNYRKFSSSEKGKAIRSINMQKLNNNKEFQTSRLKSLEKYRQTDAYILHKKLLSDNLKLQHKNGQADSVRKYFKERFEGSQDQKDRRQRCIDSPLLSTAEAKIKSKETYIKNNSNGKKFKRTFYQDTELFYQSSYEEDFLNYCFEKGIKASDIKNGKIFNDDIFYESDFILFDEYIVEIKSRYIEKLQEASNPGSLNKKRNSVLKSDMKWLYILDKNYIELDNLIVIKMI